MFDGSYDSDIVHKLFRFKLLDTFRGFECLRKNGFLLFSLEGFWKLFGRFLFKNFGIKNYLVKGSQPPRGWKFGTIVRHVS